MLVITRHHALLEASSQALGQGLSENAMGRALRGGSELGLRAGAGGEINMGDLAVSKPIVPL